jgi:hypothetical protein
MNEVVVLVLGELFSVRARGAYGSKNLAKIAKALDVSQNSIRYRANRMSSFYRLQIHASIYHTNLGLKKAVLFTNATTGYEDLLFDCLKVNPFYIYLTRYYGICEGCFAIYTIPVDHCAEFEIHRGDQKSMNSKRFSALRVNLFPHN